MDPATFTALQNFLPGQGQQSGQDFTKLLGFFAQEMQLFFGHIQSSVKHFQETGELPHSLFTAKAVREVEKKAAAGEKKKDKVKRKPTAFNLFVRAKIEELKASGVKPAVEKNNNALFGMAVAEWGKLSDDQKKAYAAKCAAAEEGLGEGEEAQAVKPPKAAAPPPAAEPAAQDKDKTEGPPKKKKKKHHKEKEKEKGKH